MGILQRLFGKTKEDKVVRSPDTITVNQEKDDWELLPGYIPAEPEDTRLVTLIASSIAASDQSESEFKVKKIWQRNPEVVTVSLIATSIASIDRPDSQLVVKSVYRKK
ncbi:hypothetical protein A9Q68_06705 [Streptococcus bovimastitidis]|uniref:Uncharacterized protein n=1 Tax=Streptococcus bovimastitidis TaxID=1856638 RepID=A0A1L8MLR2_9STRE|nr:hypothetical protein [Streptococcus bovimastitidis]OJF71671.1 hypothetical protein A9Q68_06705 [Streptococcus bovimastitidis]